MRPSARSVEYREPAANGRRPLAHRIEGLQDGIAIGYLTGALSGPPQQFEDPGLREFRRTADTAVELIDPTQQPFRHAVELFFRADQRRAPAGRALQCLA
jgi:hypothetical protein